MVLTKVVDIGIKIGTAAFRYGKSAGRFTSGETTFITRFPPRYRQDVRTILKGASTVTYGGLISDTLKNALDDTGMSPDAFQKKKFKYQPRKQSQAYYRRGRSTKRRYCKQRPNRRYS